MGTLLKVLTVIVFLLSIFAFVLGLGNFNKRELLIGRTHTLETAIIQLSNYIEASAPAFDGVADHSEWDVDDVSDRELPAPAMSEFWENYDDSLTASNSEKVNLGNKKIQLASYYALDSEGNVKLDIMKRPVTEGPGTMKDLLKALVERAKEQYSTLANTRNQLQMVSDKLSEVAELLNEQKKLRRENLRTIKDKEENIATLEDTIVKKDGEIARVNREKNELSDQVTSLNDTIAQKDQELSNLTTEVARLKEEVKRLSIDNSADRSAVAAGGAGSGKLALTAGVKGSVVKVNRDGGFVIVKLNEAAVSEISAAGGNMPAVEMHVYRTNGQGEKAVISRLRISNPPDAKGLVIADNIYGWEQDPVQVGDEVIY